MDLIPAIDIRTYARMSPAELRQVALVESLFVSGKIVLKSWETDRAVIGGAMPARAKLTLSVPAELAAAFFNERRELGVINLGGPGMVRVDDTVYPLAAVDCLYIGRGARKVVFGSDRASDPARYYLLSYPAHAAFPTTRVVFKDVKGAELGDPAQANARTIHKFIHPDGVPSCQLVMGVTMLKPGSVWNTMPPHTHLRRSEVYLYFNLQPSQVVFHFLGKPDETRHLIVREGEAALSPPWSIHCGVGTAHYSFAWGMGGENQVFADMDPAPLTELR